MATIAETDRPVQGSVRRGIHASASGGLLILAEAWAALGGRDRLLAGLHWHGRGGALLLFVLVVVPLLPAASVQAIATTCALGTDPLWAVLDWGGIVSQRRLARFADCAGQDWAGITAAMLRAWAEQTPAAQDGNGIIAVDSTTSEKRYGRHLPHIRPVYDSCQRKLVDGYELVTACVVTADAAMPVSITPHRQPPTASERAALKRRRRQATGEEWPTKLDEALALVERAVQAGIAAATVVGDGAFAVNWWLRAIATLGRHWLVATREDRRLRIGAEIRPFRDWVKAASLVALGTDSAGRTVWGAQLPAAVLLDRHCQRRGLDCRPSYFERRDRHGRVIHRWYFVTSQLTWDLATVWEHWGWRWRIEVFHREIKQHLHLQDFHARTWGGIVAWVACTSLRASLVWYLRATVPQWQASSTDAVVAALSKTVCLVQREPDGRITLALPPALDEAPTRNIDQPDPWSWLLDAA